MTNEPQYIYVASIGRKSGKPHLIEIWFVEHNGRYYLCSENRDENIWVQNMRHNPNIAAHLAGGQSTKFRGTARPVDPDAEAELHAAVAAKFDAKYDWSEGLFVELTPDG